MILLLVSLKMYCKGMVGRSVLEGLGFGTSS